MRVLRDVVKYLPPTLRVTQSFEDEDAPEDPTGTTALLFLVPADGPTGTNLSPADTYKTSSSLKIQTN